LGFKIERKKSILNFFNGGTHSESNLLQKNWQNIIWNNKDICINNKSIFYKNLFESGIIYVNDLLSELNNIDSYNVILNTINKTNFLVWAGLRHAISSYLKTFTLTL